MKLPVILIISIAGDNTGSGTFFMAVIYCVSDMQCTKLGLQSHQLIKGSTSLFEQPVLLLSNFQERIRKMVRVKRIVRFGE